MTMIRLGGLLRRRRARRLEVICPLQSLLVAIVLGGAALAQVAPTASAATPSPGWMLSSLPEPTNFSAADNAGCLNTLSNNTPQCDTYELVATNVGDLPIDGSGSDVTLTDALPAGLTVQRVALYFASSDQFGGFDAGFLCSTSPAVQCTIPASIFSTVPVNPSEQVRMDIYTTVDDPGASGPLTNAATISGGGAVAGVPTSGQPTASTSSDNTVGESSPAFGLHAFSNDIAGPGGQPDTQAGGHPVALSTMIDLNNGFRTAPDGAFEDTSIEDAKDVVVDLPLGFLGSATSAPQCTFAQLSAASASPPEPGCPPGARVGSIRSVPFFASGDGVHGGIFNMVPEHGVAAEFGYTDLAGGSHALYARVVPTAAGYVLQVTSPDVPQISLEGILLTFYGDPAAIDGTGTTPAAMFTMPADCNGQPLVTTAYADSWQHPGGLNSDGTPDLTDPNWVTTSSDSPPVTGCNQLQFNPTISVQPDSSSADSPSGLDVEIRVPQSEDPNTLATPPLKKAVVTLPQGISVNPAAANGLGGCSPAQIDLQSADPPSCPDSSKVGTVELQSPLLSGTLTGSIYLATQGSVNGDLLAGYIVVDDPTTGVVIKIPGNLTPDPQTGQITGVFDNNPQFPFSDLKLHFFGGNRGELATPTTCGTYTTDATLTPWSAPDSGPPASLSDSFQISSGPNGGPCVSSDAQRPLNPGFIAHTTSPQAGSYSPFVLKLTRQDGEQNLTGLDTTLPPGLLGKLAGIPECSDSALASISSQPGTGASEQANPACPAGSQLGTTEVGAGAGPDPFYVPGKVYLAGPYKGAPYSLAIVTPAIAGPLDLGTIVVRAALYIDKTTAQITAVSDPIPTIIQGIPLRIRDIRIKLDHPDFTVNPTSCDPMSVTGTVHGSDGASAPVSDRFQAAGCSDLPFAPKFSATILNDGQGMHRSDHPNLRFTLHGNPGDANVRSAQVLLPPSFQIDQANLGNICSETELAQTRCAGRNTVGTATATTPLLDYTLSGPVYAVSGSGGLPRLAVILNGPPTMPIQLILRGDTTTAGNRIQNTFATVPDAPVTDFSLTLNGGPGGYLVDNTNVCGQAKQAKSKKARKRARKLRRTNLSAGAQIDGQNGKTADQQIPIMARCASLKHRSAKQRHRHG